VTQISLNISPLLQRLGIKGGFPLPLQGEAIPTIQVADASEFVSPLIPPRAWVGILVPQAGVGIYSQAQVVSRAPGGCFVEQVYHLGAVQGDFDPNREPLVLGSLAVARNMGPTPIVSTVEYGSFAAKQLTPGEFPVLSPQNWPPLRDAIYVPPGRAFVLEMQNTNKLFVFNVLIRDVRAPLTPDSGFE